MFIGKNRRPGHAAAGVARSIRIGISATGLMLAGTAMAPATAQVLDLGGVTVTRSNLTGFTEVTNGVLRLNPLPAFTYGGALTDSLGQFSLVKIGTQSLTLSGSGLNTYSGLTTVSSGLLAAGAANVLSPNSVLSIGGGQVDIAGFNQTVAGLAGNGPLDNSGGAAVFTVQFNGNHIYNGLISGDTAIVVGGTGQQTFGGLNTYTGGTTVTGGIIGYVGPQAFGSGDVTIANAATLLAVAYGSNLANNVVLNADLTADFGQSTTWSGDISGGAANQLIKVGNGALTLTGNNSFAGGIDFQRGQINVGNDSALGTGAVTTTATQVTLATAGDISVTLANAINLGGLMNFELPGAGNRLTLDGPISGVGQIYLKTGDGTLVLNGANTHSGDTLLASGFLGFGNDSAAGTGAIRVSGTGGISAYNNVTVANQVRTSNSTVVNTRGFDMTLAGVISNGSGGPGGLEKTGAGTLVLTAANTYTAETFVTEGTLQLDGSIRSDVVVGLGATLSGSGSVANANLVTVNSGGIVNAGTAGTAGTLTVGNMFLGNGAVFNVDLADPNVIGGGVNDLIIVNDTLTLDSATINVFGLPGFTTGTYRVMEFTNLAPGANLLAGTAPVNYFFTVDINEALGQVNLLVSFDDPAPPTAIYWDGSGVAGDGIIAGGSGTWNAVNTNWTDVNGTAVSAWGGDAGIFQTVGGTVTVVGTQAFNYLGFVVDGYVLNGGTLQTAGSEIDVDGGATTTINSVIAGAGGLNKTGGGNLVLNATNTYSGGTTLANGTLTIGDAGALAGGDLTMGDATTLVAGVDGIGIASTLTLNGNAIVDTQGFSLALSGPIVGGGSLDKRGVGTLVLDGLGNTYSGGTSVNGGTLVLGNATAAGTGLIAAATATTLEFGGGTFTTANAVEISGVVNFRVTAPGDTWTLSGVVADGTGPGALAKTGDGTLVLAGTNSYTGGTQLYAGTLTVAGADNLGSGALAAADGTTFRVGTTGGQTIAIANDIVLNGALTVGLGGTVGGTPSVDPVTGLLNTDGNSVTLAGVISGGGSLVTDGNAPGNLTLAAANSYTGGTTINRAAVSIGTATSLGSGNVALDVGGIVNSSGGALTLANNVASNGFGWAGGADDLTLDGVLSGSGSFFKVGADKLTLANAANSFGGDVDVYFGNLAVTGGLTNAAATVTVRSGATLSGNGTIAGTVTIQDGGNLNPGTSPGTLTVGSLVLNGASNSNFELGAADTIGGAFNDLVVVTGNLTLDGNLNVTEPVGGAFTLGSYQLFQYGGTLTDNGLVIASLPPSGYTGLVQTAINGQVNLMVLSSASTLVQYWDGPDYVGGVPGEIDGGSGTWALGPAETNWTGAAPSEINSDWQQGSVAVFTTIGGTVTLADTIIAEGLQFAVDGYTLTAGELDISANMWVSTAAGTTATIDSLISGGGILTKQGDGTLVLGGVNTYSGGTLLTDGTIVVTDNSALGTGALTMSSDTTLAAGVSGLVLANAITTLGNGIVDSGAGDFTLNGVIDGAGSISQVGTGNLILNGNNSFTNLGINQGTVTVGTNTAAGIGSININDNATLRAGVDGLAFANATTTTANGIIDNNGFAFTMNGNISGAGSISSIGLGTLVLNGNNAFNNLGINEGTVQVGTNTAAGIGSININDNATLKAGVDGLVLANATTTTANGIVDNSGFTFTLNGDINGAGSISSIGLGNLVLNGNNGFTNLGINQGRVTVGTNTAAGIGTISINNDATLAAGANGLVLANDIGTTANGLVDAGGAGNVFTLNGGISGPGSISQIGLGTLVLNGNNSFVNLGINQGTVVVGTNTAAGSASININNNATLKAGVDGLVLANPISTTANGIVDNSGFIFTLNGDINGAGSISSIGLGTLVLNGNNGFNNLGINQGTVIVGTNTAAGAGSININNNATLKAGVDGLVLANPITTTANGIVDNSGFVFTLNGDIGGAGSISSIGLGTLVLNGNNSFTNLGINQGTVIVGTNTAAGAGSININNNAILKAGVDGLVLANPITTTANGIVDNSGFTFTLDGDIGGAGSISSIGLGNLVLNGDNSFTNLGINQGTVTVGTDTAAGIGAIAINNNATLAAGVSGLVLANAIETTANGIVDSGPGVFTLNGDIIGAGSISQVGTGNLVLNGDNSFVNLGINRGTVTVGSNTAAGSASININDNAILKAGVDGLVLANPITTTANGIVDNSGFTFTLDGDINGAGSISSIGLGNLVLNGNNGFTNLGINQGTVTVGTNSAAGIGAIAINNNATLAAGVSGLVLTNTIETTANGIVDSGPGVFTLDGDIIGAGSISQVGTGNLVLNGDNSFVNLGINRGTVTVGTNTAAGAGAIAINNNATLAAGVSGLVLANSIATTANGIVDSGAGVFTLNGSITGPGSISQVGTGNLVLNGNNSFTNLGINRGKVTVGTNTAAGIGSIAINNNATLAAGVTGLVLANSVQTTANGFVDSGAGTFGLSGPVSGAGSITKLGTGKLTLSGTNSFTGGLIISAGTVEAAASGLGNGNVVNNAALIINQPVDGSFGKVISGTGTLTKSGAGALTLSGINTMTGPTTVSAGRLIVTGSLGSSATTVQSGASLWGTGTVGSLTVQAGGTVAPGAVALQSGTLTVNGSLTLAAGSTLVIDAGSDLLRSTGPATIAGNLVVNPVGTGFRFGEQVIVQSSNRTGQFATTSFTGGFGPAIDASIGYTATSVILELNPTSLVAAGGDTLSPNSFQVASAFDTAVANGYDANPFFALYNQGPNLNNALLQLSGELHSAERRVLMEDTRVVRETAFDRLNAGLSAIAGNQQVTNEVGDGDFSFWLRGMGAWGNASADDVGSSFNTQSWGVLTGIDYGRDGYKVGAMFYYTSTDIDYIQLGQSTVETTGGAIYGGYRADAGWAVGLGGAYAGNNADGTRTITAPGLGQTLQSSVSGTSYQVFGEVAYDLIAAPGTRAEPFVRVAYAGVDSDEFREVGGIAALEVPDQSNNVTLVTLGLRGAWEQAGFRARASAGWQYATGDLSGIVESSITGLNSPMFIQTVALDQNSAALEVEASYGFTSAVRLGIGYSGIVGPNNANNSLRGTLSVAF